MGRLLQAAWFAAVVLALAPLTGLAAAPEPPAAIRASLSQGRPTLVVVEFDGTVADAAGNAERTRRHISRDDPAILALRAQGYAAVRAQVEAAVAGSDAASVRSYVHFPLALWRLSSLDALSRLQRHSAVRRIHPIITYHPVSVSDLPFINQPQTAAEGAKGAGTTIAVIDGGLGTNYTLSDFGNCTAVATPASTCRFVYDHEFYPGQSSETMHGTNVSAIALGVAPGANLAMFDVFQGTSAFSSDILQAMDEAIGLQSTYNIVAISMSLGDGSSNATQCGGTQMATAVDNAAKAGITTVIAAGNNGSKNGLANPACTPEVVSVGAVYDAAYGSVTWNLPSGTCTDVSAADKVTCFSQSASYLSILAPGSFVSAPNSTFQESGTSQATPHVAGSIAVLRARYPAESLGQTLQRLQLTGIQDTDAGNNLTLPRLNLLAATNQGTALSLSGSGPTTAVAGSNSTYSITVTNSGPLAATDIKLDDALPSGASYVSGSAGCTLVNQIVVCSIANLAAGASVTITFNVQWNASGAVYDAATVTADQLNSAPLSSQVVAFGQPPPPAGTADAPLPAWAYLMLGAGLVAAVNHRARQRAPGS